MLAHVLLASVPLAQAPFEGLRPGETIGPAPSPAPAGNAELARGRVVDALTGVPVAGAELEAWTEGNDVFEYRDFRRAGAARSDGGGCFALPFDRAASKARVRAPGYVTLSTTSVELRGVVELYPAPAEPPRLAIVDTRGQPIAGALVTSTYSCSHDVPAVHVETGPDGIAALAGFGLQARLPSLRVHAAGYRAAKSIDARPALLSDEPWTVVLPRQPAVAMRVLDEEGAPLADALLSIWEGRGDHTIATDGDGRATLASRYEPGELQVRRYGDREGAPGFLPGALDDPAVRLGSQRWSDGAPTGELVVRTSGSAVDLPPVRVLHDAGWTAERAVGEPVAFPAGPLRVVFGGAFSGFEEHVARVTLAPGERREVAVPLRREPRVFLRLPEGTRAAWIEAGGDASVRDLEDRSFVSVPANRPVAVFARTADAAFIVRRDAVEDGEEIDVAAEAAWRWSRPEREPVALDVTVAGETPDERGEWSVISPSRDVRVEAQPEAGRTRIAGPAGVPFIARYRRPGFVATGFGGRLGVEDSCRFEPVRHARLELEGPGWGEVEASGLDLHALHPGPLELVFEGRGGEPRLVRIRLLPGEHRRLSARDLQ